MKDFNKQEILKKRAKSISRVKSIKTDIEKSIELLEFSLNNEKYAFETIFVKEVFITIEVINVPSSPDFLYGIFNYRGRILPVIDLRVLFGLPYNSKYEKNKLVVLLKDNFFTSVIVDDIGSVRSVKEDSLMRDVPSLTAFPDGYIKGIESDNLIVLNGNAILDDKNLIINETV